MPRMSSSVAIARSKSTCDRSTRRSFSATSPNLRGARGGSQQVYKAAEQAHDARRLAAQQASLLRQTLGSDESALRAAGLGIRGALAVIGFFMGPMRLGH